MKNQSESSGGEGFFDRVKSVIDASANSIAKGADYVVQNGQTVKQYLEGVKWDIEDALDASGYSVPSGLPSLERATLATLAATTVCVAGCEEPDDDDDTVSGDDDDDDSAENPDSFKFLDMEVEPNPNNPLSFKVTYTTDQPVLTRVIAISEDGEHGVEVNPANYCRDDVPTTDHEIYVNGLYSNTTYFISAYASDGERHESEEHEVKTGALDDPTGDLPHGYDDVAEVTYDDESLPNAWILGERTNRYGLNRFVMFDMKTGKEVWASMNYNEEFHPGEDMFGNGEILVTYDADECLVRAGGGVRFERGPVAIDFETGDIEWEGVPQPDFESCHLGCNHHAIDFFTHPDTGKMAYAVLTNSEEGSVISVIDYDTKVEMLRINPVNLPAENEAWAGKGNHVQVIPERGWITYNGRLNGPAIDSHEPGSGWLYIMDLRTGEPIMAFGDPSLPENIAEFEAAGVPIFEMEGDHSDPWPIGSHGPLIEVIDENTLRLMVHDNGNEERGFTRTMVYELDLITKKARIVFEYEGDVLFETWGNAVPAFDDQYVLANWAAPSEGFMTIRDWDGELHWKMDYEEGYDLATYHVEIIDPIVEQL